MVNEENAQLKEQLNKNSKNSSKPPSSDGLSKPNLKAFANLLVKNKVLGHKGTIFSIIKAPDIVIEHMPSRCKGCELLGNCVSCSTKGKRYEIDIVIETKVTLHQILAYACPQLNHHVITGTFPEHMNSTMQYGINLQSLVVSLNTVGMVSTSHYLPDCSL